LIAVKTHDYCVPPQALVNEVVAKFERDHTSPGVIVWDGTQVLGVLSRQRCLEHLSQRFGTPLFSRRPLRKMLATIVPNYLLLQEDLGINEAASRCLGRPAEVVYEPVVVLPKHGRPRLLSVHDLLLAQSRLLRETQALLVHSAKMNALGQLVAGVAHEINNPLAFVISNLGTLQGFVSALQTGCLALRRLLDESGVASLRAGPPRFRSDMTSTSSSGDFAELHRTPWKDWIVSAKSSATSGPSRVSTRPN